MKRSAGILLYQTGRELSFFLVHPGGPFWKNKDSGAWSVPKGEFTEDEDPLVAALREFKEETGILLSNAEDRYTSLSPVKLKSGKTIYAWASEQEAEARQIVSNDFEIEWPPRSGKMQLFPEVDKAGWFTAGEALEKINEAQRAFILEIVRLYGEKQ